MPRLARLGRVLTAGWGWCLGCDTPFHAESDESLCADCADDFPLIGSTLIRTDRRGRGR